MIKSKKKTVSGNKNNSEFKLLFTNASIQAIIFVFSVFLSYLFGVKYNTFFVISVIGLCVGNFVAGFITGRAKKQNGLVSGVLYSLLFNFLIMILSLVMNSFSVDFTVIVSFFLPLVFSCIGGVIAVNIKRKSNIKR